ncbi:ribonuclease bn [Flammeovirgaceae bacterium 311]|nr:ribonuclease bn [Flammeovirgaceae bacterium 311]
MAENKLKWKDLPGLIKETYTEWNNDEPWRQSAVVAYYAIFSLPALLIIVITIAGSIFGEAAVQGELSSEIGNMIGPDAASEVETMISNAYTNQNSTIATIIGIAVLIFGATGVFYQLQQSLNNVWNVEANENAGFMKLLKDRVTSFSVILVIGFLMLISLLLTTLLSVLSDFIVQHLPDYLLYVFYVVQFLVSFGIITLLFAMIFKILPDVDLEWRTVWTGAIVTAALFVIGKFALGIYFGRANPGSAYGAAGSIILILLWVSYSCLILFFGAEFTKVYARRYLQPVNPSKHAKQKNTHKAVGTDNKQQNNQDRSAAANKRSDDAPAQKSGPEIIYVQRKARRPL